MRPKTYPNTKSRVSAWRADKRAKGLCGQCGKNPATEYRCKDCKEKVRAERGSKRRNKPRKKVHSDGKTISEHNRDKTEKNLRDLGWSTVGRG